MGVSSILNIGHSGLVAAKAGISTTGHNISNANTEGFSRQRVRTEAVDSRGGRVGEGVYGSGTRVARIERVNDEYIEKHIRGAQRDLSQYEERDMALKQVEDVFNEMGENGLNRLVSRFFNDFRRLSEEPENPAVRQALRESSQSMVNDFHRLRKEVDQVRRHIDQRIGGYVSELNQLSHDLGAMNDKVRLLETSRIPPNDLLDQRDTVLKKMNAIVDISMNKDGLNNFNVDMRGIGPLVVGSNAETLSVESTPGDDRGKVEGAFDVMSTGSAESVITHSIRGGRLGALIDVRDNMLSTVMNRLDEMALSLTNAVNEVHVQGVNAEGISGIHFFKPMEELDRASEFMSLSEDIQNNVNNIATALDPGSPGDNRVALAISKIQNEKILNRGTASADEWYNSIVSDVGIASARNHSALNQQKDIFTQLTKVRDQISGVSIDEETTNLLQFQHAFDASAKVIQVADELLKTVLSLKRD